jgi:Icc protein
VRLIQFTDTHLYGSAAEALRGIATWPTLRATLTHAASGIAAADAILVTGDLVQDDPAGYALFRELFAPLGKKVLCLPGNHDDPVAMQTALTGAPFQYCGLLDDDKWRVVMLDSFLPGSAAGQLTKDSLRELDLALAGASGRHVLVCLHHHPIPMQSRWLDTVGLTNAAEFFAVLDRYANVRCVLWGHVHQNHDSLRNGVRLLATPSTCAQFLPESDDFAIDSKPPAYRLLRLNANGSIVTEVKWVS